MIGAQVEKRSKPTPSCSNAFSRKIALHKKSSLSKESLELQNWGPRIRSQEASAEVPSTSTQQNSKKISISCLVEIQPHSSESRQASDTLFKKATEGYSPINMPPRCLMRTFCTSGFAGSAFLGCVGQLLETPVCNDSGIGMLLSARSAAWPCGKRN